MRSIISSGDRSYLSSQIRYEDEFTHDPLSTPDSLRLLQVSPAQADGSIQIHLVEATNDTPYICLSYTWGYQFPIFSVRVNGRVMWIRKNLYRFLNRAVQRFPNQYLWIDAICINQGDNEEKSKQVQRMGSIYRTATEVLVWLGSDAVIEKLLDWACTPQTKTHKALYYMPVHRTPNRLRDATTRLAKHPYWTRAWVTQELWLARDLRLLCGSSEISGDALSRCLPGELSNLFTDYRFYVLGVSPLAWKIDSLLVPDSDVRFIVRLFRRGNFEKSLQGFWQIFSRRTETQCQDTFDRIYSILALTGQEDTIQVDYNISSVALFWNAVDAFDAWTTSHRLYCLWRALELDLDLMLNDVEANKNIQSGLKLIPCRFKLRSKDIDCSCCGGESRRRLAIKDYSATEVWLCAWSDVEASFGGQGMDHFLIRPAQAGSAESFTVLAHNHYSAFTCPNDLELWCKVAGTETRVHEWAEVLRIYRHTQLDLEEETGSLEGPCLLLKLGPNYLYQQVEYWVPDSRLIFNIILP